VWQIIETALTSAGFTLDDVVRVRMYVTSMADAQAVLDVHRERFQDIRPAATLVEVSGLLEPSMLVEIEAEARRT
jgi:enamine deaminase RidA (YjgF/YER057c/UK114 family)